MLSLFMQIILRDREDLVVLPIRDMASCYLFGIAVFYVAAIIIYLHL
jgi:hypothetical protein